MAEVTNIISNSNSLSSSAYAAGQNPLTNGNVLSGSNGGIAPHMFKLKHFPSPTWCTFCTKFIWGLGKQGYCCKSCKYPVHIKCVKLVPPHCPKQAPIDPNSKKSITRARLENLNDLASAMKAGVEVKERKYRLKSYPNCFIGQEAVDWMLVNLPIRDREEAVQLGNKLLAAGYVKHAVDANKIFKDGDHYYYFEEGEKVQQSTPEEPADVTAREVGLQDFETIQVIGRGGFGSVLKVKKKDSGRVYAMKVMNKSKVSGDRQLQCLIAEKNIMLNDNPFLVHLHYSFTTPDKLYFVMDYISGGDLAFHLEQKGRFNEKEVRVLTAEIVLALEHLHSCGIIYRDLKLENILLDKDGHICLTDFGLSKELETVSATTKTVCGTPTYLAPEVLLGRPYGNGIDWWSLGVVLYELFTGTNPFDAKEFDSVLNNILHSTIYIPDYVPREAKELMEKLLQRNPERRMCSGTTGSAEIQNDPFYEPIDWKKLMVKAIKPPFLPKGEENFDPQIADNVEPPEGKGMHPRLEQTDFTFVAKPLL